MPKISWYQYPVLFFFWSLVCFSDSYLWHAGVIREVDSLLFGTLRIRVQVMLFRRYIRTSRIRPITMENFVASFDGETHKAFSQVMLDWAVRENFMSMAESYAAILGRSLTAGEYSRLYWNSLRCGYRIQESTLDKFKRAGVVLATREQVHVLLAKFLRYGSEVSADALLASTGFRRSEFTFTEDEVRVIYDVQRMHA